MLLLDVNVLVAAQRADHPHHQVVRRWFEDLVSGPEEFATSAGVWASFLRITTHRRIFEVPTPMPEAFAFVDAVVAQPRHLRLEPGPRHLALLSDLCRAADVAGDLVPDAVLGAIAQEHAATVATLDRDFARFTTVDHVRPG